jgi:phosphoribosylglycinamide formyltransferase-1
VKLGILASHEGTTLQAVIDACAAGAIAGQVVTVVSNNGDSHALERARKAGVAAYHLSSRTHPDPAALDAAICAVLERHAVDVVVLAGYMKRLGARTLGRFPGSVLNTHPARLPKFGGQGMYGLHVHRAVLAAGEVTTGASVHLVTEEYDAGPVIAQCEVPVEPGDTPEALAERVQARERRLLVDVLGQIADERLSRTAEACIICRRGAPNNILLELAASWVTVNEDAPMRGYACLVLRRHAVELHDLTEDEGRVFMQDIRRLSVLQRITGAVKLNYEVHGNTIPHLHMHFYPRYPSDPFEGGRLDPKVARRPVYAPGEFEIVRARLREALLQP